MQAPRTRWLLALVLASTASACAAEGGPAARRATDVESLRVPPAGPADAHGPRVVDAALGESYEGTLERLPKGTALTRETAPGRVDVYRVRLERGQTLAAMARSEHGRLDPVILLRNPGYETVAEGRDQAVAPFARQTDSLVAHTAEQTGIHYVFVSPEYFTTSGRYHLDLLALSEAPQIALSHTSPALRAYAAELRRHEPDVRAALAEGWVHEGPDGHLALDPEGIHDAPLERRAELNRLLAKVEADRRSLFGELLRADGLADTEEGAQRVGRVCAELWSALRASSPASPRDA